ncbi:MAG: LptF/LptG family permease [Candidatus Cyclobacteriaceae bacterium M2_1C_046]
MKKIDKLILSSFLGPFILTFLVVVFILLTQHMIKYFDDIVGKDLGWDVLGTLLFYFAVFMTPIAIPLAVLLSSLITFGNLGEHFELTAIKASGISLIRALFPIFIFVNLLTVFAFYSNNTFVPTAALEAYSLLYDIKQKKPSLDLREGTFYNGIPDYSIKVEKKFSDGQTLKDIIIYDHSNKLGNKEVTLADSGKMYTFMNDRYLKFELFNGNSYVEGSDDVKTNTAGPKQEFTKSSFKRSQIILDLSSFQLKDTDKELFASDRNMRNLSELEADIDSMNQEMRKHAYSNFTLSNIGFTYLFRDDQVEVPEDLKVIVNNNPTEAEAENKGPKTNDEGSNLSKQIAAENAGPDDKVNNKKINRLPANKKEQSLLIEKAANSVKEKEAEFADFQMALSNARQIKSRIEGNKTRLERAVYIRNVYDIQWNKILSNSFACISMFLIGAPLGAIIKRGGLGVPVLVSIMFFIIFYVINMTGEKYAKQAMIDPWLGIWAANIILLPIGIFFLRQARVDARLFDSDFYNVMMDKLQTWVLGKRKKKTVAAVNQ